MPDPASLTGSSCSTTPFAGTDPIAADATDACLVPCSDLGCESPMPISKRDIVHLSLTRFNQFLIASCQIATVQCHLVPDKSSVADIQYVGQATSPPAEAAGAEPSAQPARP